MSVCVHVRVHGEGRHVCMCVFVGGGGGGGGVKRGTRCMYMCYIARVIVFILFRAHHTVSLQLDHMHTTT